MANTSKTIDTIEFQCVWDSDWLVKIPDDFPNADDAELQELINKVFRTHEGKRLALEKLTKNESS